MDENIIEGVGTRQERVERAQAILDAIELAKARNDYYVSIPGRTDGRQGLIGPLSEQDAYMYRDEALDAGRKPLVLKVVEDYGK